MYKSLTFVFALVMISIAFQSAPQESYREFAGLKGKVHQVSHGNQSPALQDVSHTGESETYDEVGNLIATVEVGADAYLEHTYVYIGAQTVFEYWGEKPIPPGTKGDDSRFSAKWVYKYDGNGKRIQKSVFDKKGKLVSEQKYLCDRKGRLTSQSTGMGKVVNEELKFQRDEKGNVILLTNEGEKTTYRYVEFDSAGNWTKRVVSRLGIKEGEAQPTMQNIAEERSITYY